MPSLPVPNPGGGPPSTGSRCTSCTALLAADQLFCLSCGARRRDARIPFRDVLASEATPILASGGGAVPPPVVWGDHATGGPAPAPGAGAGSMPLLGMALCLLLALGLGVWIGRGQDPAPVAASPYVAAPAQAAVATTPTDAADTTAEDTAKEDKAAADDAAAADTAAADTATAPEPSAEAKALENLSPNDYQKQAQKLPSEVGTGGTAPPKDDKPAGGGSGFEDFN